jgi:sarcosine/dimethylglycine N-methyltransferase
MTINVERVRAHNQSQGLVARIDAALPTVLPAHGRIDPEQLAGLDQFHTRGLAATLDLARELALQPGERVLDVGCGLGGPARVLAKRFAVKVEGVDLSASFIEAAQHLNKVCDLHSAVTVSLAEATNLPFADGAFDAVMSQHVVMNIADRTALYRELRRILRPGGRFASYDVVRVAGEPHYPLPWARDPQTSFLLSEAETQVAVESAGFAVRVWRNDTAAANEFFAKMAVGGPPAGPTLGLVMGPDFPVLVGNLAQSIREGRLSVLCAVCMAI